MNGGEFGFQLGTTTTSFVARAEGGGGSSVGDGDDGFGGGMTEAERALLVGAGARGVGSADRGLTTVHRVQKGSAGCHGCGSILAEVVARKIVEATRRARGGLVVIGGGRPGRLLLLLTRAVSLLLIYAGSFQRLRLKFGARGAERSASGAPRRCEGQQKQLTTNPPTTTSFTLCTALFNHSNPARLARPFASATAASMSSSWEERKGCTWAT